MVPHNKREEEKKYHFYEELQQRIDGCNRNDIMVVMGNFNAKVGGDNEGYKCCIGRCGMGDKNDNVVRLIFLWQMAWLSQEHCFSTKIFI